jgi:GH35 family endo-1,4-beta-xylanase
MHDTGMPPSMGTRNAAKITNKTTYHIVSIDTWVSMMFGTLMDTIFLCKLWPTYIEQCFQWAAHECDLTCTLLYNDDKVEGIGTHKSEAFYQLLADLVHRKVPIVGGTVGGGRGSVGI